MAFALSQSWEETQPRQNLSDLLHGQTHDVREGSLETRHDPFPVVLDAVAACLVEGVRDVDIAPDRGIVEFAKGYPALDAVILREPAREAAEGRPRVNAVGAPREQAQHPEGIRPVCGLVQHPAIKANRRIRADHDRIRISPGHPFRLERGIVPHQLARIRIARLVLVHRGVDDFEAHPERAQELAPARRSRGENEAGKRCKCDAVVHVARKPLGTGATGGTEATPERQCVRPESAYVGFLLGSASARRTIDLFPAMRIGLAQINTTVGDLAGNRTRILEAYDKLVAASAGLVVFPELVVTGYPPRDLLFKRRFVPDNEASMREIARHAGEVPALVGFVQANPAGSGRSFFNAGAFCRRGAILGVARKCLLPTYDVFDEDRYFEAADEPLVIDWDGRRVGVTICEDIWTDPIVSPRRRYPIDPVAELGRHDIALHVNLSASPWHNGKGALRRGLITSAARTSRAPLVYCNAVGGNDELIFDGRSTVAGPEGKVIAGLSAFREELRVVEIDAAAPKIDPTHEQEEMKDIREALVLGLRDYAHKSGFKRALLGLSGGIDSAVTAVLVAEVFGAENVTGVSLPSRISSEHSKTDARDLAANLGIAFHTVVIADVVGAAEQTIKPLFEGRVRDTTEENIQARARGMLLMAMSNKFGSLLLTTGNKSELAVGYCTLYGDMCGGLAVISDLPKVKVYELAEYMNREREIVPRSSIDKPPSAELRPDQKDEDSLPPYPVLDAILRDYVEEGLSSADIIARGFDEAVVREVVRKVDLNEYKRKQAVSGLKITPLAFGVGRRIPIVQKYVH